MVYYCVYNNCKSNSRRIKSRKVRYYPFPKPKRNLVKCFRWIELCGNKKLTTDKINKNSFVCSKHFVRGFSDPVPFCTETIEVGENVEVGGENSDNLSPMVYSENYLQEHNYHPNEGRQGSRSNSPNETCDDSLVEGTEEDAVQESGDFRNYLHDHSYIGDNESIKNNQGDHSPSGNFKSIREMSADDCKQSTGNSFTNKNKFSFENFKKNQKVFKYFCGLDINHFEALYNFLDESVMSTLKYSYKRKNNLDNNRVISKISDRDKLCLTLVRLRRGFTLEEMSYLCSLSESYVSVIFFTWVQFMYYQIIGIRGDQISKSRNIKKVPNCFKNFEGRNVNFVLDTTEVSMEIPSNFRHHGNTSSSCKHPNTVKFLIMICTSGYIVYCSDGFEGSISDVELFEKSDLRVFLKENDVILANRDFLIGNVCDEKKVKVYMPPFLADRDKLTAEEKRMTKKIAKTRIHVERAIGRMKSYRILSESCPILLLPIVSQMFTIICFLVNFDRPLV